MSELSEKEREALEKLFIYSMDESSQPFPPQINENIAKQLLEKHLIYEIVCREGRFNIICHELTPLGHLEYCASCKDEGL